MKPASDSVDPARVAEEGLRDDAVQADEPAEVEIDHSTAEVEPLAAPMFLNQLPPDELDSMYEPQNNLGSPPGQTEADSSNRAAALPIKHRVGTANFSFGIPFASLDGRGIDAGFGTVYNSRTWNKSCSQYASQSPYECTENHFTYDVDQSWIAPGFGGGFGYLETTATVQYKHPLESSDFQYFTEFVPRGVTDPDGTRRQMTCVENNPVFPGTYTSSCKTYRSSDGTHVSISARPWVSNPGNGQTPNTTGYEQAFFTVSYPDGSKIIYSGGFGSGIYRKHYPLVIQDNNGNRIRISYKDNLSGRIDTITDTINRQIKFYYENDTSGNPDKLVTVTIPGMTGNEIQTVRLYYEDMSLTTANKFGNQTAAQVTAPSTVRVLKWVYMPSTKSAYKYIYHPNYGMITKIERRVGVTASSTSTTATGTISEEGVWAATTEYDFPSGENALDDVPRYTKRTDSWPEPLGTKSQETLYESPDPVFGQDQESEITVVDSDNGFNVETKNLVGSDGMLKETTVTKRYGPGLQYSQLIAKSKYTWTNRNLTRLEVTNDSGLVKAAEFEYDSFNNRTKARECGYAPAGTACTDGTALRITETGYESGSGWISANLLGLVKSVQSKVGGNVVSKMLIEYDHGADGTADDSTITQRTDIDTDTHSTFYNPNEPSWNEEICPLEPLGQDQQRDEYGCITINHPGYGAASAYRGNVTRVGRMLDVNATAITSGNADITDYDYDIAGNLVSATLSCCQLKTIEYGQNFAETGYAFPTKEIKGTSPQLITEATYNKATGLVTQTKDENNQPINYEYEADTLRLKKSTFVNGGFVENFYSDKEQTGSNLLPGYVKQKSTLETNKFAESISYFDARGLGIRSASLTPDGWSISAVELDKLGRPDKTYNPFYGTTPNANIPSGTKFVEMTGVDGLGRTTSVKLQDDTTISTYFSTIGDIPTGFNKTFVVLTDQAGKQRRQVFDSLGRLVRVDEPDAAGVLPDLENPVEKQRSDYGYDGNDNLVSVIQSEVQQDQSMVTQERKFKYDSLSRLVAEKQVEASPTLTEAGVHGTADPSKWTKVLKYNADGLLAQAIDARNVTTTFDYDGLNRVEEVIYSDGTPKLKYYYDQARTGYHNKGALTKVETIRETSTPADIFATSAEFDYDQMGRLRKHRQWINGQQYDLEYEYNLAGQLTSQKYPSGRIVANSYDANGRLSGVADAQRPYLSGMEYLGKGNSMSQMSLGNGTTETFTLNDRFQMMQQELKKGSDVLQKYVYGYGHIDPTSGNLDTTKNNGQLGTIESYIGSNKQATQKFKYDQIGRLKEAAEFRGDNGNLTYKQVFDFDRFGNMYRKAASNPTTGQQNPLAYTAIEEATGPGTGDIEKATNRFRTSTTYDDAGNVTADSKFRQLGFSYDANGRLYKVTSSYGPDAWTVYDASGNRVATKVNNIWRYLVYDAMGKLVAEYGVPSDGLGGVKYVQQDWQGSVRTITNANGFAVARTDHQAFGGTVGYGVGQRSVDQGFNTEPATRQGYGLTERDDATGLDYTWFRKNENAAGRWTSPDPYNGSMNLGDPQSFNRYSYVQNDPTNFVDPSGLNEEEPGIITVHSWTYRDMRWLWYLFFWIPTGSGGFVEVGGGGGGEDGADKDKNICDWFKSFVKHPLMSEFFQKKLDQQRASEKEQGGLIGWFNNSPGTDPLRTSFDNKNGDERNLGKEGTGEFLEWAQGIMDLYPNATFRIFYHTHRNSVMPSKDDVAANMMLGTWGVIIKPGLASLFGDNGEEVCTEEFPSSQ
ncbi:MAG: RHS repeat protein [Chloracidobacterium sp.]|nr:RHS repeat protein [Chloracidobacterium sp.]